ncbi:MAG: type IX secretion system protein PorQ [Bacteroidetes bacterium]|nr:type IX secretion system protein PorQ [Bacteroidota bacterium]
MVRYFCFTLYVSLTIVFETQSQSGGKTAFQSLNISADARTASMGGNFISVYDNDISSALQNPALINHQHHQQLNLSIADYFSDIKFGTAAYARSFKNTGTFIASLKYIDYGTFTLSDEFANQTGTFNATDFNFNISFGRPFFDSSFTYGITVKGIASNLAEYSSYAVAADAGIAYQNQKRNITASLLIKNAGRQVKTFTQTKEKLPFEIQFGFSKKLGNAPIRFNLNLVQLQTFDLTYESKFNQNDIDQVSAEDSPKKATFFKKAVLHLVPGIEILLSKNFHLRGSYHFLRRYELAQPTKRGTVGFSFGAGIKVSKFYLDYARSVYHLSAATNQFTLAINFNDWYRKKTTPINS